MGCADLCTVSGFPGSRMVMRLFKRWLSTQKSGCEARFSTNRGCPTLESMVCDCSFVAPSGLSESNEQQNANVLSSKPLSHPLACASPFFVWSLFLTGHPEVISEIADMAERKGAVILQGVPHGYHVSCFLSMQLCCWSAGSCIFFFAVMVIASCDGMYGDGSSMYGALFCGSKK